MCPLMLITHLILFLYLYNFLTEYTPMSMYLLLFVIAITKLRLYSYFIFKSYYVSKYTLSTIAVITRSHDYSRE